MQMSEVLGSLLYLASPGVLLLLVVGTVTGIVVGAIPGLTGAMVIALALPLTFGMTGTDALVLLVSMYVGSVSGGSDHGDSIADAWDAHFDYDHP